PRFLVQVVLLEERQHVEKAAPLCRPERTNPGGEPAEAVMAMVRRETQLPEVVATGDAVGHLANLLHGRQQQANEHRDDGNHDQQFDQGVGPAFLDAHTWSPWPPPSAVNSSLSLALADGSGSHDVAEAIGQEATVEIREHLVKHSARPALN